MRSWIREKPLADWHWTPHIISGKLEPQPTVGKNIIIKINMTIAESGIHSPNPFLRKGTRLLLTVPRTLRRIVANSQAFKNAPPTLANSFPKSGTHLLDQIVSGLPHRHTFGTILDSMNSPFAFRERSDNNTIKFIRSFVPGELVRAHLFHKPDYERELSKCGIVHFFIYRDLRDVVISEAHYIRTNPWHPAYAYFHKCETLESAISLAINGLPPDSRLYYPNVAERFQRYGDWLYSPTVFSVRFEDLTSCEKNKKIKEMVLFYANRADADINVESVVLDCLNRINPLKSHTFREGGSGGWRKTLTNSLKKEFKEVAGQLLLKLQFEDTFDW